MTFQGFPSSCTLQDGRTVVAWEEQIDTNEFGGRSRDIFAKIISTDGTESPPFLVNTYLAGFQGNCNIIALDDGGFLISYSSSGNTVRYQAFDGRGLPRDGERILNTGDNASNINSAYIGNGKVGFAFVKSVGNTPKAYIKLVDTFGKDMAEAEVSVNATDIKIASDGKGGIAVVYKKSDGSFGHNNTYPHYAIYDENLNFVAGGNLSATNKKTFNSNNSIAITYANEGYAIFWVENHIASTQNPVTGLRKL